MIGTSEMTKCVLAIDDDETILTVMNNVLTMHDYEAVTASQWVEALDVLNERTPDLLLLDLQMPHVDGFFLLEWVREQEIEMPVIVVSAYLNDEAIERLKTLGVDTFIWKPFNVAELVEKIDLLLTGGSPAEPSRCVGAAGQDVGGSVAGDSVDNDAVVDGLTADDLVVDDIADDLIAEGEESDEPVRRRRIRRRTRGTKKRQRRRLALYLCLIAVISVGISGLSIYMRNVATSVEQAVEESIANRGGENELLKELLRKQFEQDRRVPPEPKKLDLNLQRK